MNYLRRLTPKKITGTMRFYAAKIDQFRGQCPLWSPLEYNFRVLPGLSSDSRARAKPWHAHVVLGPGPAR